MKNLVGVFDATTASDITDIFPPDCGYNKIYKHKINTGQYGVGFDRCLWLTKNCKSKWGWYFVERDDYQDWDDHYHRHEAVLTFKSKKDAVYYMLTHA